MTQPTIHITAINTHITRNHWYSLEVESGSDSKDDLHQIARVHHILPQTHHICSMEHRPPKIIVEEVGTS
ncbi:hypothetical protein E2C01_000572 [Portunus trituberculatus]|uniref:Uncharacterized protein n=1 Tax=Portunus trituberculatus TaxID=210409 RepID=A0A5B7CEG3_PORTR|nr:hypothetical protein [Portunus trituberculatus]